GDNWAGNTGCDGYSQNLGVSGQHRQTCPGPPVRQPRNFLTLPLGVSRWQKSISGKSEMAERRPS
ncbi:MAG: hypothetical protein VYC98_14730, partial [Planctomycetota bacterium]|nr:hypothetical protein [Planctomycetota bacterium]